MLVTIIIITYNSSIYVQETLNSVLKQTYPYNQLEIIISDDCSTDHTPDICRKFIKDYNDRFARILFTQTPYNKGICGNYNHALMLAQGKWIKYIAGDDRLKFNCIERFVAKIEESDEFLCCGRECFTKERKWYPEYLQLDNKSPYEQLKEFVKIETQALIWGATFFLKRSMLLSLGGFDEKYPMSEDYQLNMKYLLSNRKPIKQVREFLIEYREYNSVSKVNPVFMESCRKAQRYFLPRAALRTKLYLYWFHYKISFYIQDYSCRGFIYKCVGYSLRLFDIINYKNKYL